ncbi:Phosphatidylglycerol/phosphatidylinositol transfer protein, variant 2 [Orbilia ellipsospora]|uniref:Phosphatidylglycerol/phosphatidylinositol transfer protein n=1 Tax=Orbilia ellipsospora TaxID=2528407 RepID=A0AAV9X5Q6_9PEZI
MKVTNLLSVLATAASASALSINLMSGLNDQSPMISPATVPTIPGGSPITYCVEANYNPKNDLVDIERISIDPNPPVVGKSLHLEVSGDVKQRIEEGAVLAVEVKLGVIRLIKKDFDFCDLLSQANVTVSCPIEPGHLEVIKDQDLPAQIPPVRILPSFP